MFVVLPKKFQVSNYIVNPIKKVSEFSYWLTLRISRGAAVTKNTLYEPY